MTNLPSIEQLLPHDAPMVLIDELVAVTDDTVHCQVMVSAECLFYQAQTQSIPAYVGIEFMAQSVGAWSGYHGFLRQLKPEIGFLLGTRRYQSNGQAFLLGQRLDIYAEKVMQDNGMAVFKATIESQGEEVASCQLNVYVPSEQKLQQMKSRSQQ